MTADGLNVDPTRPILVLHAGIGFDFSLGGVVGTTGRRENLLGQAIYGELQGHRNLPSTNVAVPRDPEERSPLLERGAMQFEIGFSATNESGSAGTAWGLDGTFDQETGVASFDAGAADISLGGQRRKRIDVNLGTGSVTFEFRRDQRSINGGSRLNR